MRVTCAARRFCREHDWAAKQQKRAQSSRERGGNPAPISSRFLCPRPPFLFSAPNQNRHAIQGECVMLQVIRKSENYSASKLESLLKGDTSVIVWRSDFFSTWVAPLVSNGIGVCCIRVFLIGNVSELQVKNLWGILGWPIILQTVEGQHWHHFLKETGGVKLCGIDFTTKHVSGVIVSRAMIPDSLTQFAVNCFRGFLVCNHWKNIWLSDHILPIRLGTLNL